MSCPVCSSDAGRALRDALADGPVALSLLATLLPFAALAVVVRWVQALIPITESPHGKRDAGRYDCGDDEAKD